jgi:NAD(P)-dependent dehydrogenase (short-subunit alcohol dehydrogenase family)
VARPTVVITGASAGVGRATARAFGEHGFNVALVARGSAGLEGAVKDLAAAGVEALAVPTDVAYYEQVNAAAERVEAELGPIDVWINDAMTTVFGPLADVDPGDFQRAVEVTFLGQVWGTKAALDRMRPRNRGSVVNIGSALAFVGIPLQSAYCAAKFACRGFFESTRAELLHDGSAVKMSMVHLPAVNTPQFDWCKNHMAYHPQPVPPIYQPETVAKHILAVALDGRRSKVIGSWNKMLVATDSLLPGVGNQYAALAAWESQLTSQPAAKNRPVNLFAPVDEDQDAGAHGIFDNQTGGVLNPKFLSTMPHTAKLFGMAVARAVAEKRERIRRSRSLMSQSAVGGRSAGNRY